MKKTILFLVIISLSFSCTKGGIEKRDLKSESWLMYSYHKFTLFDTIILMDVIEEDLLPKKVYFYEDKTGQLEWRDSENNTSNFTYSYNDNKNNVSTKDFIGLGNFTFTIDLIESDTMIWSQIIKETSIFDSDSLIYDINNNLIDHSLLTNENGNSNVSSFSWYRFGKSNL